MDFFTTNEMERKTGVKRLRLHSWIKDALFVPSTSSKIAGGHGVGSLYSQEDLYKIALLKKLLERGMHGKAAAAMLPLKWNILDLRRMGEAFKGHVLLLCVIRRFENGQEIGSKRFLEILGSTDQSGIRLTGKLEEYFNIQEYDDAIIINMTKLIAEVDKK
ncbi:MAG: MerR family transcriptional regulator [Syntrophales bacterium]